MDFVSSQAAFVGLANDYIPIIKDSASHFNIAD
jgi:hypothetical protein